MEILIDEKENITNSNRLIIQNHDDDYYYVKLEAMNQEKVTALTMRMDAKNAIRIANTILENESNKFLRGI